MEVTMPERSGLIAVDGKPLTLTGSEIKVGDEAPDAAVIDNDMKPVRLSEYEGKVRILSSVPSLDTPVCDMEVRRFNKEAADLGGVLILTISMDLPFAQKRWCGAAGVELVHTLSDYRAADFGEKYGVLIKELRLLARAVFVVDREGVVRYIQIVDDLTNEPDYDAALDAARKIA
jgi:thiol peroxidase